MRLYPLFALLVAAATLASCDALYEEEGDCTPYCHIQFVYEHNMEFADAFAAQVETVDLYVFDTDGRLVMQAAEDGEALKADGFRMTLDIDPGRYTVLAWCGLRGAKRSYEVPQMTPGQSTLSELRCRLADRTANGGIVQVGEIDRLYHGMTTFQLSEEEGQYTYTVPLVKNTNDVRIILENMSGHRLSKDDFIISITDENGLLDYDNRPLADELLTYRPFYTTDGIAGDESGESTHAVTSVSTVLAELTISRLYINKDVRPMLTITKAEADADGTHPVVLSIPLIDYALLVKGYYNREMDDQEYLDRQDEYNLTFFLDENNNWISSSIIINAWTVVLSETELQ